MMFASAVFEGVQNEELNDLRIHCKSPYFVEKIIVVKYKTKYYSLLREEIIII